MAPQSRGGQELKTTKQQPILEHPKTSFCVAMLLLLFKDL
jgi:hypothetical protein